MIEWKNQVVKLICTGHLFSGKKEIKNEDIEVAINLLYKATSEDPGLLLNTLAEAIQKNITGMMIISLSIIFSKADKIFLSEDDTLNTLYLILSYCDAKDLLNLVKNLKYKTFGKGLGSGQQKIVRRIMEAWSVDNLKSFIFTQPSETYSLLRLIHPRYRGERGELVKDLLITHYNIL